MPRRIGLFISRAGGAVSRVVDVDSLAGAFKDLAQVAVFDDLFSAANRRRLFSMIETHRLDAVVLAGESPMYYQDSLSGSLFLQELIAKGINPNLIAFANLKEQVALAHPDDPVAATVKAKALIEVAVSKVNTAHPLELWEIAPRRSVGILGTTVGGVFAAQRLLEAGFHVYLVEEKPSLRDRFSDSEFVFTLGYVQNHPQAEFVFGATIADVYGWCGDYTIELSVDGEPRNLSVGGIVAAVGDDVDLTARLQPLLQIDTDEDGNFRVKNPNTLPVQTKDEGKVVIPAHNADGRFFREEIAYADSAALSLQIVLSRNFIQHPLVVSELDSSLCGGCGTCVRTCAFKASSIDLANDISVIDPRRCKGCGNCVVACPVGARDLITYPGSFITAAIDILSGVSLDKVRVLAFLCNGCGYPAADRAGTGPSKSGSAYPAAVMPLGVECGGRIDTEFVLHAFKKGFDGVLIARCRRGHCHNIIGNRDLDGRMSLFRQVLREIGVDVERLRIIDISPDEGKEFAARATEFVADVKKLEPSEGLA